jgi:hypothetical protein
VREWSGTFIENPVQAAPQNVLSLLSPPRGIIPEIEGKLEVVDDRDPCLPTNVSPDRVPIKR